MGQKGLEKSVFRPGACWDAGPPAIREGKLVDVRGIEPLTSSLRTRRSPS